MCTIFIGHLRKCVMIATSMAGLFFHDVLALYLFYMYLFLYISGWLSMVIEILSSGTNYSAHQSHSLMDSVNFTLVSF